MRLFFVAASDVSVPRKFDEQMIRESAGRFLVTLKNVYGFFALYANFGWAPSDDDPPPAARPLLDRWALSRLAAAERDVDALLGAYDATAAARRVIDFFDGDVSKWYVRLARDRFWGDVGTADARSAFATLHEILVVAARLLAPFAPFVTDWMHRELTGASVHLADYTRSVGATHDDLALERAMDDARQLVALGRAAREHVGINVRQPLPEVLCVVPGGGGTLPDELTALVRAELNVKAVRWLASSEELVTLEARANFRALGKRFGKSTPLAAAAVAALSSDHLRRMEHGEAVTISVDGADHALRPEDLTVVRRAAGDYVVQEAVGYVVALNPAISDELRREGMARELVSRVQRSRKDAGLQVSDRIRLLVVGDAEVEAAARHHREYIAGEVLARRFGVGSGESDAAGLPQEIAASGAGDALTAAFASLHYATQTFDLDGRTVRVTLSKDER